MKKLCFTVIIVGMFCCKGALANPVSAEVLRIRQVPHSAHVQVTWAVDPSLYYKGIVEPTDVTRDGTALSVTWWPYQFYKANTGSGLADLIAVQFCDCDVAVGTHTYEMNIAGYNGEHEPRSESIIVETDPLDPPDAGVVGDVHPWDIPEPAEVQGIDCVQSCGSSTTPDGGGVPDTGTVLPDAGSAPDAIGTNPVTDDQGGCSVADGSSTAALMFVLGMVFLFGLRRRRS
ncbi:MAG: MYXO-CTERM sorting domain-containing protein [Pseudomonadota bacterium]